MFIFQLTLFINKQEGLLLNEEVDNIFLFA